MTNTGACSHSHCVASLLNNVPVSLHSAHYEQFSKSQVTA